MNNDPLTMTRQEYDEYTTKAMLLGRNYDWQSHSMWKGNGNKGFDEIDADTLELLEDAEVLKRKDEYSKLAYSHSYEDMMKWRRDQQRGIKHVSIPDPR